MQPIKARTDRQLQRERREMQDYTAARTLVACLKPNALSDPLAAAIVETWIDRAESGELDGVMIYGIREGSWLGLQLAEYCGIRWNRTRDRRRRR